MEFRSDMSLLYLIRLQRIAEEVYATFHLDKLGSHLEMEQLRLQTYVRTYKSQIQDWKASLPPDVLRSRRLQIIKKTFCYANVASQHSLTWDITL